MKLLSTVTLCGTLFLLLVTAPFAFAQADYSAGGATGSSLNSTAVCGAACSAGPYGSAYGNGSSAGPYGSAYGYGSTAYSYSNADNAASAYGSHSSAGPYGSAYGYGSSTALCDGGSAYGYKSTASDVDSSAYGYKSTASRANSVALGSKANAAADNSVALGSGSVANEANTVSVGQANSLRRITNVAPGIHPTDAVTMGQFRPARAEMVSVKTINRNTLAQTNALAELLIEKGIITQAELREKLSLKRAVHQRMLKPTVR